MINFFTPAANDASLQYLSTIFGNMNGIIPGSGGTLTIFGTMFRTFNSVALAIGALIVVYITVVGVMMTAHEGEFMKKWNSLWTPVRTVIGIASLVPTASGFSGLQILMMWVIVQGVGAADTLWNTVLSYVSVIGSPYAQVQLHDVGVSQAVNDLYKGIVCDQSARATYAPPYVTSPQSGGYYCNDSSNGWCTSTGNIDPTATSVNSFQLGPNGACGTLTYCNQSTECAASGTNGSSSLKCMTCTAQVIALANIITTLRNVADIYVKADYDYQNYYYNGYLAVGKPNPDVSIPQGVSEYCAAKGISSSLCRGPVMQVAIMVPGGLSNEDPLAGSSNASNSVVKDIYLPYFLQPTIGSDNFLDTAVTYYMNAIGTAVSTYLASQASNENNLPSQLANAQSTGWIFAGGYYYTITQVNSNNLKDARPTLTAEMTDPQTGTTDNPNVLQNYRNNFAAASALVDAVTGNTTSSGGVATNIISGGAGAITDTMIQTTSPGGSNPLVQLAAAGYGLLMAAQITFAVFLVVAVALGVISGVNLFVIGSGGFNPMAVSSPIMFMITVPLLFGLLAIMVSMGALLGVYTPLIPYVIFTFGAIGWLTSTIETMVAGPLVALAILAPGGHHEILGKAEPALLLLFNVFLRPSLMIFGLIAAMLLANVVLTMINAMFGQVLLQIIGMSTGNNNSGSNLSQGLQIAAAAANPLEMAFFLMAYTLLIIAALNKCFAAIHIIPERVMRWVGGQGEQYGEGEGLGEMKKGIESGAGTGAEGMKEGVKSLRSGVETKAEQGEAKKAALAAKKTDSTPGGET